jgi:hypothetical protein
VRREFTAKREEEGAILQQVRQIESMATGAEQALARAASGWTP